jgi:hypothetical protein
MPVLDDDLLTYALVPLLAAGHYDKQNQYTN